MHKTRPVPPSTLVDARKFVVGVLESGDATLRAAMETLSRAMYPGPQPALPEGERRGSEPRDDLTRETRQAGARLREGVRKEIRRTTETD
jgi:hypothetical protein